MVSITPWGGVDEIGGNKFLLACGDSRVLLDFGMSYNREGRFFEQPFLQPSCLDDLLKTGCVPRMAGLYKNAGLTADYDPVDGVQQVVGTPEEPGVDAVLLSHAHMDHYGYLGLLRPDIPVYSSPLTCRLLKLRGDIHDTFCSEVKPESVRLALAGEPIDLGQIQARSYPVDHSVPGATGWILEADGLKIGYTGDLRMHGPEEGRKLTEGFLQTLALEQVDFLLCEGTRLPRPETGDEQTVESHALASEDDVFSKVSEILASENGLVIYDASPADLGRLKSVCLAAKEAGRKVAIDAKQAYLMLYVNHPDELYRGLPCLGDVHITLGRKKLASNSSRYKELGADDLFVETFDDGRTDHEKLLLAAQRIRKASEPGSRLKVAEEASLIQIGDGQFIWGPRRSDVMANPGQWLMYTANGPLMCLHFMAQPGSLGGSYIYGKAEPFNQEMEFSFTRLNEWLKLAGLELHYAHTSGHIREQHLAEFLAGCGARCVMPIHTENPDWFTGRAPQVRRFAYGQQMDLR